MRPRPFASPPCCCRRSCRHRAREILRRVGAASDSLKLDRDGRWRPDGERMLVQDAALWPRFDKKTAKETLVSEPSRPNPEPGT